VALCGFLVSWLKDLGVVGGVVLLGLGLGSRGGGGVLGLCSGVVVFGGVGGVVGAQCVGCDWRGIYY